MGEMPPPNCAGAVLVTSDDNIVVYLDDKILDDPAEVVDTIVHESVHVWQAVRDAIGEAEPAREQEAYTIAKIVETVMHDFAKYTEKQDALSEKWKARLQDGVREVPQQAGATVEPKQANSGTLAVQCLRAYSQRRR